MADISEAARMLMADDARLNDEQDLIPMVVPGFAGNDKAGTMIIAEFRKRLRRMIVNRNGERLGASQNLSPASASFLDVVLTPTDINSRIRIEVSLSWGFSGFSTSELDNVGIRLGIQRGNMNLLSTASDAVDPGRTAQTPTIVEPFYFWVVDAPNTIAEVTYSVFGTVLGSADANEDQYVRAIAGCSIVAEEL